MLQEDDSGAGMAGRSTTNNKKQSAFQKDEDQFMVCESFRSAKRIINGSVFIFFISFYSVSFLLLAIFSLFLFLFWNPCPEKKRTGTSSNAQTQDDGWDERVRHQISIYDLTGHKHTTPTQSCFPFSHPLFSLHSDSRSSSSKQVNTRQRVRKDETSLHSQSEWVTLLSQQTRGERQQRGWLLLLLILLLFHPIGKQSSGTARTSEQEEEEDDEKKHITCKYSFAVNSNLKGFPAVSLLTVERIWFWSWWSRRAPLEGWKGWRL